MLVAGEARRYSAGQGSVIERDKKLQRKNWREDDKGEVEGTQKRKKKNTNAKDAKDLNQGRKGRKGRKGRRPKER